jgi:hypothetical protein
VGEIMKVIPISAEVSYARLLREIEKAYRFNEYPEETQALLRVMYRKGWEDSKLNTLEILETITCEANDGTEQ